MSALYELDGVVKRYGTGNAQVTAVGGADLRVEAGEFLALVGPSGSGKTTLLQLLGAMDRPSDGRLAFEGRELGGLGDGELSRLRREAIGFVFQQFNLIPTLTAEQNVAAALAPVRMKAAARRQRARELLGRVRLEHRLGNLPSQLSGGEQQRVAIARALANDPAILLADEPTGNLDSGTGHHIIDLLIDVNRHRKTTVVLVTHDPELAARADVTIALRDGHVVS